MYRNFFSVEKDIFITNSTQPTRFKDADVPGSNLDLIFVSPPILQASSISVVEDSFASDHYPVLLKADVAPGLTAPSENNFCFKKIRWGDFRGKMEEGAMKFTNIFNTNMEPKVIYEEYISLLKEKLLDAGSYISRKGPLRPLAKPLWWNARCDELLTERRNIYRWYEANQSAENRNEFHRRETEIKRALREMA